MRRLLTPLLVLAMSVGLLSAAPTVASAAPPTSSWSGAAGGDTASVDLNVLGTGGLQLAGARLATSQADSGSQRTPRRSTARSANLGVAVATLPITVLSNDENAGPAAGGEANVVHMIAPVPTRVPVGTWPV